jgi:hypothetical protein
MKKLLVLIFLITPCLAYATHIVGGEYQLVHIEGTRYSLRLVQYFDEVNGDPEAEDDFAQVYLYRKSDDVVIRVVNVTQVSSSFVPYTNPACTDENIIFRKITYQAEINLPPADFSDPQGYYAVFERCCRNSIVSNLVSPETTGQTFLMEFPAVTRNNAPFINSTPQLADPISDYACIDEDFNYFFGATDPDGDSLAYSLTSPLNSSRFQPVPTPSPQPHDPVTFVDEIDVDNMVPGAPALNIDKEGRLRVKPNELGVFVFGLKVEEFRDGEKIGEVRRDYQLLVADCNPGEAPEIMAQVDGADYPEGNVIALQKEGNRCIEILVTDKDPDEVIRVKAEGVNFDNDIQNLIPSELNLLAGEGDTLRFDFCLPACPFTEEPMLINLIAQDDACSQPLTDTLQLTVEIQGARDSDPFIYNNPNVVEIILDAGNNYSYPIRGLDEDEDLLQMALEADGFDPLALGMQLQNRLLIPGEIQSVFSWNPDCETADFSEQNVFEVDVVLNDLSDCPLGEPDILTFRFTVKLPTNNRPILTTSGLEETEITIRIDETLAFDVLAEDIDNEFLELTAVGNDFNLNDYNIYFPGNQGIRSISSPFSWRLSCNVIDLSERSTFDITFLARDQGSCNNGSIDSLKVTVNVLPPLNEAPGLAFDNLEDGDTLTVPVNRFVNFDVFATDADNDIISLRLTRAIFNGNRVDTEVTNFNFFPVLGRGEVSARFNWQPACLTIGSNGRPSELELFFVAEDSKCFNVKNDTISVLLEIVDRPLNLEAYTPRNAITPNGDGQGDYFFLRLCNDPEGNCDLPEGNCNQRFRRIDIVNRWGKKVYTSDDPDFEWYAQDMPAGIYYYNVYYSQVDTFRGQVYVFARDPD